ncbi:MAG TPA: hypothetical protein PLP42_09150 [Acidobacteriota bacterium]|nr:hypothetical protein [Acidobacteriota bacterium]
MLSLELTRSSVPDHSWVEVQPKFPADKIFLSLFSIACAFLVLHIVALYLLYFSAIDSALLRLMANALDLNNESTIATWYSSATLLSCAAVLGLTALGCRQANSNLARYWFALSLLVMFFSADEVAQLHEKLNGPVRTVIDMGSFFGIAWVLPGVAFVIFLMVSLRGFYKLLPAETRFHFALGALVFFGGSLGVEMLGGHYSNTFGRETYVYALLTGAEEFLEMTGVAVFIYGTLRYLNARVRWRFRAPENRLKAGKQALTVVTLDPASRSEQ